MVKTSSKFGINEAELIDIIQKSSIMTPLHEIKNISFNEVEGLVFLSIKTKVKKLPTTKSSLEDLLIFMKEVSRISNTSDISIKMKEILLMYIIKKQLVSQKGFSRFLTDYGRLKMFKIEDINFKELKLKKIFDPFENIIKLTELKLV